MGLADDVNPRSLHGLDGVFDIRRLQVDALTALNQQVDTVARLKPVQGRGLVAVIGGEADDVDFGDALGLEVGVEARGLAAVVGKARVAVKVHVRALANDRIGIHGVETWMEIGSLLACNAVIGPEPTTFRASERDMVLGVKVLREDNGVVDFRLTVGPHQVIDEGQDRFGIRDSKAATRAKVALNVDNNKGFTAHGIDVIGF